MTVKYNRHCSILENLPSKEWETSIDSRLCLANLYLKIVSAI